MAISDVKARNNAAHMAKLDRIVLQPYKEQGQEIRNAAQEANQSLQGYILQAVAERIERDKRGLMSPLAKANQDPETATRAALLLERLKQTK